MNKRNLILTSIVAVVALFGATLMYAQPRGGHGHGGPGGPGFGMLGALGHLQHVKEELGLSDAQSDEIKAIFKDLHEQNAQYRDQIRGGLGDITDTLLANPNDVAAAQAILNQQTAAETAMKTNALKAASKALAVLTPEQRTKLASMIAERRDRRREER